MNTERTIAGIFVGAGALLLIYRGNIAEGCTLLGSMVGFFIGEKNGQRTTKTPAP
jgi:uncharacterized membrane protein required for colicin V production